MVKNVRSTGATFSSITLSWDELDCVNRNGEITGYLIEYNFETTYTNTTRPFFTNTGLSPETTYSFRVAAVNSNGTGTPSTSINATTLPSGIANTCNH